MAMMVRRRRRQPGDDGEGEEADPEGLPLHDRQLEEEQLALEDGEDVGGEETLEGPKRPPTTLTPMTPLFTPEQLKGLHEVQSQAPHLYAQVPRQSIWQPGLGNRSPEEVQKERPTFLPKEEGSVGVLPQTSTTTGTPSPALVGDHVPDDQRRGRTREPRVPEVQEPESDSDGRQPPQPREQSVVQIQGNGPGGRGLHVPRGFGQTGPPGYIMPHEERRGPMPHQGGWQVQLHPYGPGPPNPQEMMTMLAMLKQENQQLQIQQAELMDAMKYQRASLEAKVHDLQRELEQQVFRTPESDEPVNRQLELTVDEPPRETDLEVERRRLYELTPMQQFEQLQSLMGTVTPAPAKRGGRGQGQRERSRSQGPRTARQGGGQPEGLVASRAKGFEPEGRQGTGKGVGQPKKKATAEQPGRSSTANVREEQSRERGGGMADAMSMLITYLVDKDKKQKGPESVKPGTATLPVLAEPSDTAPIDLADWLTMVEPAMTDLSDSSGEWWELVVSEARAWYKQYIKLRPIQRASSKIEPSAELQKPKWARVEKRAISMLLSSVPTTVKEELVATRTLSPLGLVSKLMVLYQPGGAHERTIILRQLEDPPEAGSPSEACMGLRRWMRWLRRATDIGLNLPDAIILMKGINKLSKRILTQQPDLQFRCALVKNTLQLDTIPNEETVRTYAEHLLAELEQLMHRVRPSSSTTRPGNQGGGPLAVKALQGEDREKKGDSPTTSAKGPCRYFLTESGCRRGQSCKWAHQLETGDKQNQERRCFTCGATQHLARDCPRKETAKKGEGPPSGQKPKLQKLLDKTGGGGNGTSRSESGASISPQAASSQSVTSEAVSDTATRTADPIKNVLDEAHKLLKGMNLEEEGQDRATDLGATLKKLNRAWEKGGPELRAVKIARVQQGREGLLDSGATHALRPKLRGEDLQRYRQVRVTLAAGGAQDIRMTEGETLVHNSENVEPIVPAGRLVRDLGCRIEWVGEACTLEHPVKGNIDLRVEAGCPQMDHDVALDLIRELEESRSRTALRCYRFGETHNDVDWLDRVVADCPIFDKVPIRIKDRLVDSPARNLEVLGVNRRIRKRWRNEGVVVHLYAGKNEGYDLTRALKEAGGDTTRLLEVDILRTQSHDMSKDDAMYAALLRIAMLGWIDAVIGGPNCRTRSELRHHPVTGMPGPSRSLGRPWGLDELDEVERAKCHLDDVLLLRMVTLYVVAKLGRDARLSQEKNSALLPTVRFLMEQPAAPQHMPEVASFWRTEEWRVMKEHLNLDMVTFNQGAYGGMAVKPTSLALNMEFMVPEDRGPPKAFLKTKHEVSSSELARWAPGMMREIARSITVNIQKRRVTMKALSWQEHLAQGHVPFRRDCAVCQRAAARDRPHRAQGIAAPCVLSLDLTGPFVLGHDIDGDLKKYLLVGAYTWPVMEEAPWDEVEQLEVIPDKDWPTLEEEEALREVEYDLAQDLEAHGEEMSYRPTSDEGEDLEMGEPEEDEGQGGGGGDQLEPLPDTGPCEPEPPSVPLPKTPEEVEEHQKAYEMITMSICLPLASKSAAEVLAGTQELFGMLRRHGYPVARIHTDAGREFDNNPFKRWCLERGLARTFSPPDEHQSNGRAEAMIASIKQRVRRLLHASGMPTKWWPAAARHVTELERRRRENIKETLPRFGQLITVRKRAWERGGPFEATSEMVTYLTPTPQVSKGHAVLTDKEKVKVVSYLIKDVKEPKPDERDLVMEEVHIQDDPVRLRWRLREKTPLACIRGEEDLRREEDRRMLFQAVYEEEGHLLGAAPREVPPLSRGLVALRQEQVASTQRLLEDEILQTRIVPNDEVYKDRNLWLEAIMKEIQSLEGKKAIRRLTPAEVAYYQREHGDKVEVVPGKAIHAVKAPDGRRKCRLVVCGNYLKGAGRGPGDRSEAAQLYAGGADTTCLRTSLPLAASRGWQAASLDIKTAFLNAPLRTLQESSRKKNLALEDAHGRLQEDQEEDGGGHEGQEGVTTEEQQEEDLTKRKRLALMLPPKILVRLGLVKEGEMWLVEKALYGLRESPKLWGDYRDIEISQMSFQANSVTYEYQQSFAEENLWLVRRKDGRMPEMETRLRDSPWCTWMM